MVQSFWLDYLQNLVDSGRLSTPLHGECQVTLFLGVVKMLLPVTQPSCPTTQNLQFNIHNTYFFCRSHNSPALTNYLCSSRRRIYKSSVMPSTNCWKNTTVPIHHPPLLRLQHNQVIMWYLYTVFGYYVLFATLRSSYFSPDFPWLVLLKC